VSDSLAIALAAYDARVEELTAARDAVKDARSAVVSAFAEVYTQAAASDDQALRDLAAAIAEANDQLDAKLNDEKAGLRVLRTRVAELALAMREAARKGDASAAEAALAEAEEELESCKLDVKELRRAIKHAETALLAAVKAAGQAALNTF
jgi:hypothetical protein